MISAPSGDMIMKSRMWANWMPASACVVPPWVTLGTPPTSENAGAEPTLRVVVSTKSETTSTDALPAAELSVCALLPRLIASSSKTNAITRNIAMLLVQHDQSHREPGLTTRAGL